MSIIEKAVNKIGRPEKGSTSVTKEASGFNQVDGSNKTAVVDSGSQRITNAQHQPISEPDRKQKTSTRETVKLPLEKMAELGMVDPNKPNSPVAQEYRVIKRPLLQNIDGKGAARIKNANLIMVTSAVAGEGKTFSAINLAISIAMEKNKTVLFVDADVSKSTASKILEIPNEKGLIDLLHDDCEDMRDVLINTNVPNFRVLPAGKHHQHATEILASDNMRNFIEDLANRYPDRVIVFDSPPMLQTTEACVLANYMGQIVFVVAAEQTAQGAVKEAIDLLPEGKAVGLVLNKTRKQLGSQYGYGYGYGYGYAQENETKVAIHKTRAD